MSTELFSLTGKSALVTGGAQGMGRMIAEGLLRAGAAVTITSRDAARCDEAVRELSGLGRCAGIAADLSQPEGAVALAKRYRETAATCHILVNNAGKTWGAPIESFPDKAWTSIMAVNLQTPFTLIRELLPELVAGGTQDDPARVINIGSVAGARTERLQAYSYSASKAGIQMLTRDLAGDLAERNVTVNTVIPGYFPTKMTAHLRTDEEVDPALLARIPLRRLGRAEDIAGVVILLSSKAGAYITGSSIAVDGGMIGCT